MKNFEYDGSYPGFVDGTWLVDERDGHVWLDLPGVSVLEGFPDPFSLHFMETPKEYGLATLNLSDELFKIDNFKFDTVLERKKPQLNVRDYFEVVVGKVLELNIPEYIPEGSTIGSIIIKNQVTKKVINVINLRNVIVFDILRRLKLKLAIGVRTALYGLTSFNNVDLGNGFKMSFDTFYIESPDFVYQRGTTIYSSPQDYDNFMAGMTTSNEWFERYCQIPSYAESSLKGPNHTLSITEDGLSVLGLTGEFEIIKGFTGIKSIKIPYCPGISLAVRINEFQDNGVTTPYLTLDREKFINFNIVLRLIEASR